MPFRPSDTWESYLKLMRERCSEALHVLDRFHTVSNMNKVDKVRSEGSGRNSGNMVRLPGPESSYASIVNSSSTISALKSCSPAASSGGLNNNAKSPMRKSYGFQTYRVLELALDGLLGKLPEPEPTHDFF
jgi:hypothetical protein